MKSKGKLKMALMILICIVVMLVGFVGIYTKNKNKYANKIPTKYIPKMIELLGIYINLLIFILSCIVFL